MRPLLIDNDAKANIAAVVEYAKTHKYPRSYMQMLLDGVDALVADLEVAGELIQVGYKCVYTIEEHPGGWMHHLSVSVDNPAKVPSIPAFMMIMKEFGIETDINDKENAHVWIEEEISPKAVNIVAKM